jgi:hypothetical protein
MSGRSERRPLLDRRPGRGSACDTLRGDDRRQREQNRSRARRPRPRCCQRKRAESAIRRWGWIALLLHYVINPARRLTTNNRRRKPVAAATASARNRLIGAAAWTRRDRPGPAPFWRLWAPNPAVLADAGGRPAPIGGAKASPAGPGRPRDARAGRRYGAKAQRDQQGRQS